MATGDELRGPDDRLDAVGDDFRIRDGNRPMLSATLRDLGAHVIGDRRVADDLDVTTRTLADLIDDAELVVTIGGVSAGDRDFVPIAAATLGLEPCLRGVRMQPGFPASAWCDGRGRLRLAALPGNPVSCLVTAHVLVRPWIETRLGRPQAGSWRMIRMAEAVQPNPLRTACRPAVATAAGAVVPGWNGSGDLPHVVGTHGIVRLPEQAGIVEAGAEVPWLPWSADA
jgi:molybdopterin molybdotransferase